MRYRFSVALNSQLIQRINALMISCCEYDVNDISNIALN